LRVLIVDDSAVVRQTLSGLLSVEADIEVATASDPLIAMSRMKDWRPDVIVLDLEMPRMDGLTFLRRLMRDDPLPVVICSSAVGRGTEAALRAVEEGAVAVVAKPRLAVRDFLLESAVMLVDTIRGAADARLGPRPAPPQQHPAVARVSARTTAARDGQRVIALGASTGGTEALRFVLDALPADTPGIAVVQHMPEGFTRAFAERLDRSSRLQIKEAEAGDGLYPGRVLIAAGNRHLLVNRQGEGYAADVRDGPLVSRHRPSVDLLFNSVAACAGPSGLGVILTGMGMDGAAGLLEMRRAGARTAAQDEASSIVFGMPREAIARGAAERVLALGEVPDAILAWVAGEW